MFNAAPPLMIRSYYWSDASRPATTRAVMARRRPNYSASPVARIAYFHFSRTRTATAYFYADCARLLRCLCCTAGRVAGRVAPRNCGCLECSTGIEGLIKVYGWGSGLIRVEKGFFIMDAGYRWGVVGFCSWYSWVGLTLKVVEGISNDGLW